MTEMQSYLKKIFKSVITEMLQAIMNMLKTNEKKRKFSKETEDIKKNQTEWIFFN